MPDFDENIRKALENDETFQSLIAQLKEAATSEVTARFDTPCAKCGCKHIRMEKIPNYDLKLKIASWLTERGVGRATPAETSNEEQIKFERVVWLYDPQQDVNVEDAS